MAENWDVECEGAAFRQHSLGNEAGHIGMASRRRLALGCSVLAHAIVLAITLVAAHAPATVSVPEAETVAVVFEAASQAPAEASPQTESSPDLVLPSATPSVAQVAPSPEPLPVIQSAETATSPLPLLAEPPTASIDTPPLPSVSATGATPEAVQAPIDAVVPLSPSPASILQPDSMPQSSTALVPQPRTQAPVSAMRTPVPSKPAPPRSLSKAARPTPAPHPAAPSTNTPEPVQPPVPFSGQLQQVTPVNLSPAPPALMGMSSGWRSALAVAAVASNLP